MQIALGVLRSSKMTCRYSLHEGHVRIHVHAFTRACESLFRTQIQNMDPERSVANRFVYNDCDWHRKAAQTEMEEKKKKKCDGEVPTCGEKEEQVKSITK